MDDEKGAPSAKSVSGEGYNQTYVILSRATDADSKLYVDANEVFFRCGNWCYKGFIQFGALSLGTADLPTLIPALQRQQGSLRYYCNAKSMPENSEFYDPVNFLNEAIDFLADELISERVEKELKRMSAVFPWINDDSSATYFELALNSVPEYLNRVGLIASKTYTRGLILIAVYCESSIYFVVQPGDGDQALLDVRFPDVSSHGQGLLLNSYGNYDSTYKSLTVWHSVPASTAGAGADVTRTMPKIRTLSVSSKEYQQTYCIMTSTWDKSSPALSVYHDVLFRFGSWCYAGRVQLTPSLTLTDIPFVIPALRMQQSRLDFVYDTNNIPLTSPFAPCLDLVHRWGPLIEAEIANSEEALQNLIDRLSKMGLGDSIASWLEGNEANSFFEFKLAPDAEMNRALANMELVASKTYHPSGIVTVTIIYQNTVYVTIGDASKENPLLDSRFPDVSGKGRGYQVQAYPQGSDVWPALRKVSVWQTVGALEKEFRDRAAQSARAKEGLLVDNGAGEKGGRSEDSDDVTHDHTTSNNGIVVADGDKARGEPELYTISSSAAAATNNSNVHSSSGGGSGALVAGAASSTPVKAEEKIRSPSTSSTALITTSGTTGATGTGGISPATGGAKSSSGSKESDYPAGTTTAAAAKDEPLAGAGATPDRLRMARPHHVPKLDSLSKKLDEIRKSMADQGGAGLGAAPWDSKGRPLGSISEAGDKK